MLTHIACTAAQSINVKSVSVINDTITYSNRWTGDNYNLFFEILGTTYVYFADWII